MSVWRGSARCLAGLGLAIALFFPTVGAAQLRDRADLRHAGRALASPVRAPSEWAVDVMVATAIPTLLGGNVRIETPGRFLIDVAAGGNPYADGLGGLVESYGGGASGHALVSAIGGSAGVLRLQVGIRPSPDAGLELLAGYTLMVATPTVTRGTLEAVTGQSFAYTGFDSTQLQVAVHGVSGEIGWRFVIADHLVLRLGIGGTFTFASSAHLQVSDAMRAASPAVDTIEHEIAGAISRYGFVPEARVAVGYRF